MIHGDPLFLGRESRVQLSKLLGSLQGSLVASVSSPNPPSKYSHNIKLWTGTPTVELILRSTFLTNQIYGNGTSWVSSNYPGIANKQLPGIANILSTLAKRWETPVSPKRPLFHRTSFLYPL